VVQFSLVLAATQGPDHGIMINPSICAAPPHIFRGLAADEKLQGKYDRSAASNGGSFSKLDDQSDSNTLPTISALAM